MAPFDTTPAEINTETSPPAEPKLDISQDWLGILLKNEPDRELLWEAAQVIRKYGHTKDVLGDKSMGFCIFGAMGEAQGHGRALGLAYASFSGRSLVAAERLYNFLKLGSDPLNEAMSAVICQWNNDSARTQEEVVAALEGAARA